MEGRKGKREREGQSEGEKNKKNKLKTIKQNCVKVVRQALVSVSDYIWKPMKIKIIILVYNLIQIYHFWTKTKKHVDKSDIKYIKTYSINEFQYNHNFS